MDMSFAKRALRAAPNTESTLSLNELLAITSARQAVSPTGRAQVNAKKISAQDKFSCPSLANFVGGVSEEKLRKSASFSVETAQMLTYWQQS